VRRLCKKRSELIDQALRSCGIKNPLTQFEIRAKGLCPENNAQQVRRDPACFLASAQPINVPSHYVFLLITPVMASSPLLQPAGHVCGLILDDCGCNAGFRAKVGGSHFRAQFFF
jgi:hypothetical protein